MHSAPWMALLAILAALLLAGCNTMQGFGKDLETLGGKIEQKAKK